MAFSKAHVLVWTAITFTYRKWGGVEAEQTGLVNVSGEMTKAVIDVFISNGWLNEEGLKAVRSSKETITDTTFVDNMYPDLYSKNLLEE